MNKNGMWMECGVDRTFNTSMLKSEKRECFLHLRADLQHPQTARENLLILHILQTNSYTNTQMHVYVNI